MMDHLHRLCFKIPSSLYELPDGVYGDMEAFLHWLEGQNAHQQINAWEERQRITLTSVIKGVEAKQGFTGQHPGR